jgi:myo-inositol-1(or 4)-monophosphatase
MQPMLNIAFKAAREASKLILNKYDRLDTVKVLEKDNNDFVTEVDQAAEQIIIETLKESYPDHSFLGEESGELEGDPNQQWIIDPIDGTTNFIHGFPHFCISIAFKLNGKIEHGLIYDPIRQELFSASRGKGAQLNDKRIRVSQCKTLSNALIGTGFPFKQKQQFNHYLKTFEAIFPKSRGIRRSGSAALDLAYVAAGRLDGFWELSLKPWDIAAGVLLIQEAGGLVGDVHGDNTYMENGNIVVGNPKVFKQLLQTIRPSLQG